MTTRSAARPAKPAALASPASQAARRGTIDDQRSVRYRQAKRTAEESRHREPVRNASDHGRLGAGLHIAKQCPVHAGHSHRDEHNRHPRQESGSPPARRGQAAHPHMRRLAAEPGYRRSGFHLAAPGQSATQRGNPQPRQAEQSLSANQPQSRRIRRITRITITRPLRSRAETPKAAGPTAAQAIELTTRP